MKSVSLSVIIPTLNAEKEIGALLKVIESQSLKPKEVLIVDSSSEDETLSIVGTYASVRCIKIKRNEFNHGTTRDVALRSTSGDFVCFLTQDAVPATSRYLEFLIAPMLQDSSIALVSGRQLPKTDARRFEQLVRAFNYPDYPIVRGKSDLAKYGIKTFFASDVCSAYRRSAYLECGGFSAVETSEDMLMAARFIASGMRVAYNPNAEVYHSHNLTPRQQYTRNKVVGRFLEEHVSDLMGANEVGEGKRLVKYVAMNLLHEHLFSELFAFGIDCVARLLGNRRGRWEIRKERLEGRSKVEHKHGSGGQ